jgi:hypothetical protein
MSNLTDRPPRPARLAWLGDERAVDTAVAAMLDSADREEADARTAGRSRLAAASVRYLRHLATELAPHGSVDALADAPADSPTLLRRAEQDGAA